MPKQLARECAAWRAGIKAEAKRERAAREAVGTKPSGIREGLEKLRSQLAEETNEARRRALERTIESLSKEPIRPDDRPKSRNEIEQEREQFIIGLLTERVEAAYQPGLAARQRWLEAHAAIDDEGRAGRIRARAHRPALSPLPVSAERWREIFPPPGESRAVIDGIPAHFFVAKSDLEDAFMQTDPSSDEQRSEPQKEAKKSRKSHHPTRDRSRQLMEKDIADGKETIESIGRDDRGLPG